MHYLRSPNIKVAQELRLHGILVAVIQPPNFRKRYIQRVFQSLDFTLSSFFSGGLQYAHNRSLPPEAVAEVPASVQGWLWHDAAGKLSRSGKIHVVCREIGATVLIDDNPRYAVECASAGIDVLLYDWNDSYPWSKTADGG